MKRLFIPALVVIAMPALAQQSTSDPQAMKVVEPLRVKWEQAYNSYDFKALGNNFAPDGVFITALGSGPIIGPQGFTKYQEDRAEALGAKQAHMKEQIKVWGAKMLAPDTITAYGEFQFTGDGKQPINGRYGEVLRKTGDDWKIEMLAATLLPNAPAPAVGSTSAPNK